MRVYCVMGFDLLPGSDVYRRWIRPTGVCSAEGSIYPPEYRRGEKTSKTE